MKKQLLFCLMMVPTLLFAQDDNKYLAGAVPMKDDKVVFTKKVSVPSETRLGGCGRKAICVQK